MRIPAAIRLAGLLLCSACGAGGPHEVYYLSQPELLSVYGTYDLSNGDVMQVSHEQRRYWVDMRKTGQRIEIFPIDSIVFVDSGWTLWFSFVPQAFVTTVSIKGLDGRDRETASVSGRSHR